MLLLNNDFKCYWKLFFVKLPRPDLGVIEDAALRFFARQFHQAASSR